MAKFIKINHSSVNVDSIAFSSAEERVNEYNSNRYWLMRIKMKDGSIMEYARADTPEEVERLSADLHTELQRITA